MSDILKRARLVRREVFDPMNDEHIESFKTFLATNNWGEIQFYAEQPYTEAPATVMAKYARHVLNVTIEDAKARAERLAMKNVVSIPRSETREEHAARLARANELLGLRAA